LPDSNAVPLYVAELNQSTLQIERSGAPRESVGYANLPASAHPTASSGSPADPRRSCRCIVYLDELILELLLEVDAPVAGLRQAVDGVHHEVEAVQIVQHRHVEGRGDRALFLIAANVKVVVVRAAVGQPVESAPGKAWKAKMTGRSFVKSSSKSRCAQSVRMLGGWLQLHQIDDIDHADLRSGRCSPESRRQPASPAWGTSPQQAMTTSGSTPSSLLAHVQMPMPSVQCLTAASIREPLARRVLARDYDIDVVALRRQWSITTAAVGIRGR